MQLVYPTARKPWIPFWKNRAAMPNRVKAGSNRCRANRYRASRWHANRCRANRYRASRCRANRYRSNRYRVVDRGDSPLSTFSLRYVSVKPPSERPAGRGPCSSGASVGLFFGQLCEPGIPLGGLIYGSRHRALRFSRVASFDRLAVHIQDHPRSDNRSEEIAGE